MRILLFIGFVMLLSVTQAQSTEDFESETTGATSFTDNGRSFTIINGTGETTYDIEFFSGGGWNGSGADNRFIDNSSGTPTTGDGTSFTISVDGGNDIFVNSLYIFIATRGLGVAPTTLTITGRHDGSTVYTITKSSGFASPVTFSPNNGFTFIDFSTEGGSDNTGTEIDELVFSTTGTADYVAVDAFTWEISTLPVELSEFRAVPSGDSDVLLEWTTVSELFNAGFSILRSENGNHWTEIGFEEGMGTSTVVNEYNFVDRSLASGMYYYRLKQVDFDGTETLSEVKAVSVVSETTESLQFTPNPTTGEWISYQSSVEVEQLEVFDNFGRNVDVSVDYDALTLNVSGLKPGVYHVIARSVGGDEMTSKFVKR